MIFFLTSTSFFFYHFKCLHLVALILSSLPSHAINSQYAYSKINFIKTSYNYAKNIFSSVAYFYSFKYINCIYTKVLIPSTATRQQSEGQPMSPPQNQTCSVTLTLSLHSRVMSSAYRLTERNIWVNFRKSLKRFRRYGVNTK